MNQSQPDGAVSPPDRTADPLPSAAICSDASPGTRGRGRRENIDYHLTEKQNTHRLSNPEWQRILNTAQKHNQRKIAVI